MRTISTTDAMRARFHIDSGLVGAAACIAALLLLLVPRPLTGALGVELLSTAFWLWARAGAEGADQAPRWQWLRRPAIAMWLAYAIDALLTLVTRDPMLRAAPQLAPIVLLEAAAVVWTGLELVAALPLARPYADFAGPYPALRPWIPVVLPSAGFLVLWSQRDRWTSVAGAREAAVALLALTAVLAALRAFARRGWTASLRWICVTVTALALVPLARRAIDPRALFLLWLAAFGGPAFVLAGELAGATPRRGRVNARLWRAAGGASIAGVAWPALLAFGRGGALGAPGWAAGAAAASIAAWIMVGRLEVAPERRRLMRPGSGVTLGRVAALAVLALVPAGLLLAWWAGFEPSWAPSVLALGPVALGALIALAPRQKPLVAVMKRARGAATRLRALAGLAFRATVRGERALAAVATRLVRGLLAPLRDLHTGDAQEYLLLLAGVSVLALVLPLLR